MHFSALFLSLVSLFFVAHAIPTGLKHSEPDFHHDAPKTRQQAYQQNGIWTVNTNIGQAKGYPIGDGSVVRFVVKYATAARFAPPVQATSWILPSNPNALPPMCPQTVDPSLYSEDCLYAVAYVPVSVLKSSGNVPVYAWFHGGSFRVGSASDPGLDGSNLSKKIGGIVVVVQYRLGVLGLLPPSGSSATASNLAVQDAITSLKFINNVMTFFGSNNQVTIGGQSSGGHLIRALLAAPSASNYFRAATLHADPMGYGFMKPAVRGELQDNFWSTCGNPLTTSAADIVTAQENFINYGGAYLTDPAVGAGEPLRPTLDGTTVVYSLTTTYPPNKKPVFLTSNKDDAGQAIGLTYPYGLDTSDFEGLVVQSLGSDRGEKVMDAPWYNPLPGVSPPVTPAYLVQADITREALSRLGTDQLWKCAIWNFAKRWAAAGGKAYTVLFDVGITYPANSGNDLCQEGGMVCHEDEIMLIFGTGSNLSSSQSTLANEVQARIVAFIKNPTQGPNASGYATISAGTSSDAKAIQLGGSSSGTSAPVDGCVSTFWGSSVPFEWQINSE